MPDINTIKNGTLIVPHDMHGLRVDAAIAQLIPDYSRSQLTIWLKQGKITVNQQVLKPKQKVNHGDLIELHLDDSCFQNNDMNCEPEDIPLNIVYEDEHLLVINKPAGFVVHPGAGNREHTLVNALLHHFPALTHLPRAGIIHRLDKDTTGLLVVAKTLSTQTALVRLMQNREIERRYIALVQGHLISGGEIDTFYGRHPRNRLKMAVSEHGERQAITLYSIRKHYDYFTLLDVQLQTGRTHQIRVHMAHINHAVVGDQLYGGRMRIPVDAQPELIECIHQFKRQALHAAQLSFIHPETDESMDFYAPIPDDFQQLIDTLDAYLDEFKS